MKKLLLPALLLLCLAACARSPGAAPADPPTPALTPVPTATPTPTAAPTPSEESVKTLWGFPIDDTHDAFEVPTGGRLGTVLVTVELKGEEMDQLHFSVWTADDLESPIQTMEAERVNVFHEHDVVDANFDGYMDFTYPWLRGKSWGQSSLWLWNEAAERFAEVPEYADIPNPWIDGETQTISGILTYTNAGDKTETFYRWEDGRLVCFRKEEIVYHCEDISWERVIYERVNGELAEVSREPVQMLG